MSLRERRLLAIMESRGFDNGECVRWYSIDPRGWGCLTCGAHAPVKADVRHTQSACQVEFDQIMVLGRWLLERGQRPFRAEAA